MRTANTYSLAIVLLCVAAVSHPGHQLRADTRTSAQRSGCSHLRYSAVPIAARDGARLFPSDFNNEGEVVGGIADDSNSLVEAFLWKEGKYVRLGDRIFAGALVTSAAALNDRTQVVGGFLTPDFNGGDYLLDKRGVTYLVGFSPAEINDHGDIAGSSVSAGLIHGAVWRNGEILILPMAPGHVFASAVDINSTGTVVGVGAAPEVNSEALVWFAPYATAPTVIRLPVNATSSPRVAGVNNRDQVVFVVAVDPDPGTIGDDVARGYVWSAGRPLQVLEPLPGYAHSSASDINSAGLIVGESTSASGGSTAATLWRNGQTCALQDLVTTPQFEGPWIFAQRVNERGEILAFLDQSPIGAGWFLLSPR